MEPFGNLLHVLTEVAPFHFFNVGFWQSGH
jgi:hypothetical protein